MTKRGAGHIRPPLLVCARYLLILYLGEGWENGFPRLLSLELDVILRKAKHVVVASQIVRSHDKILRPAPETDL